MAEEIQNTFSHLTSEIQQLIDESRNEVAISVNTALTSLYWNIGTRIKTEILSNARADYGKKVMGELSKQLSSIYGKGWSEQHLRHCLRFAQVFPDMEILSTLWRELSWSHFKMIVYR